MLYRFSQMVGRQDGVADERLLFRVIQIMTMTSMMNATEPMTIPTIALAGKLPGVSMPAILKDGSVML